MLGHSLALLVACAAATGERDEARVAPEFIGINAITLATTNMTASLGFYGALGLNCTYGCERNASWTTFGGPDRDPTSFHVNLFPATGAGAAAPRRGWGRVIFYVRSVDAVYALATKRGLVPEFAPRNADWGERYFQILDPSGHELAIAEPLPAAAREAHE